jgi:hypothetical protein
MPPGDAYSKPFETLVIDCKIERMAMKFLFLDLYYHIVHLFFMTIMVVNCSQSLAFEVKDEAGLLGRVYKV